MRYALNILYTESLVMQNCVRQQRLSAAAAHHTVPCSCMPEGVSLVTATLQLFEWICKFYEQILCSAGHPICNHLSITFFPEEGDWKYPKLM